MLRSNHKIETTRFARPDQDCLFAMSQKIRRDVFQALADPTRREILSLLIQKELNLNSIANNFEMSRSAISQQIKILTECGLITIDQKGENCTALFSPKK